MSTLGPLLNKERLATLRKALQTVSTHHIQPIAPPPQARPRTLLQVPRPQPLVETNYLDVAQRCLQQAQLYGEDYAPHLEPDTLALFVASKAIDLLREHFDRDRFSQERAEALVYRLYPEATRCFQRWCLRLDQRRARFKALAKGECDETDRVSQTMQ